jgi:hypothetical protein
MVASNVVKIVRHYRSTHRHLINIIDVQDRIK